MKQWLIGALIAIGWVMPVAAQDNVLNLFIWSEYIDPEIISAFEAATDSRVVVNLYESNEDMIARLQGGGVSQFDVVVPSDYVINAMKELNLLLPLDQAQIPNLSNIGERFSGLDFDPTNEFTVPYQWGTTAIGFRRDRLGEDFEPSWSLLFDADQQPGNFALIDDQRTMIGAGAMFLGFESNTTTPTELRAVQDLLIASKNRSIGFIGGVGGTNQLLAGTADLAIVYNGDALRAAEEDENIGYFIPAEGASIWLDNLAIPAQAPNPELAHAFINFILDAEIGAQLSEYNLFASPNAAALELIDPEVLENPAIFPDEETMDRLYFNRQLTGDEMRLLDTVWTTVKSS